MEVTRILTVAIALSFAWPASTLLAQSVPDKLESIVVTAKRLNSARSKIQPALGATLYQFSAKNLEQIPQGKQAALNQVLLQAPGVAQDSFGQLHVRGDHNEVQYRLDGVELPEGFSVFSQALESRFAHSVNFITGALPAQYGVLQAAVIDITTKSGATDPGSEISIYGGARDFFQPSFSTGGSAGKWDWFFTGDFEHNRVGIENPTDSFNPIHDLSNQEHGLAHIDYTIDEDTRLSLIAGISDAQYQIPNNPGQTPLGYSVGGITSFNSANLNEHQREITDFAILSLQKSIDDFSIQSSVFSRYSSLYFSPDPIGDLLFTGIAQTAARSLFSTGVQSDASYVLDESHTLRGGFQMTAEHTVSHTDSLVFPLDSNGAQIGGEPINIVDGAGKTGGVYGLYLQDEWKILPNFTLNYGGRFDLVDEFTHENQFSPRVNLVWQPDSATALHTGYSHYFTPPPFELVGNHSVDLFANTSAAASVTQDNTVRAEHDSYFDAGIDRVLLPGLHAGVDGYFKQARQLIDEGQFGAPIILSAFNYAHGQVGGVEETINYDTGPLALYANLATSRAIGKDIDTAQFNFTVPELDYIAHHYIFLDHDQRFSSSAGASYGLFKSTPNPASVSADVVIGSGLRASTATIPNGRALPGYYAINLGMTQKIATGWREGLEFRFDVQNLLDRKYEIRDGTGVGVGAPQFGLRRTLLVGVTQKF